MNRIEALKAKLAEKRPGAFLVTDIRNIRYLTGFTGSSAYLLFVDDSATFITDSRYELQSAEQVGSACAVRIYRKGLAEELGELLGGARGLFFEPENITFSFYSSLKEKLGIELEPLPGMVYGLRRFKSREEADAISRAQSFTDRMFSWVLENLEPGSMTEADLALEMEYHMRTMGADGPAFPTIVAQGAHSALPHAEPRDVTIPGNTVLLLDFGARLDGYASDMTRTLWVGPKPPPADFTRVYDIVRSAQQKALDGIRAGVSCKDADSLAREVIIAAGHGEHFGHSLGHGVGLDVHEAPALSQLSPDTLSGGEVVTVEPGIYLEGQFGVRIEDMAWVREDGAQNLTGSPKEPITT